MHLLNAVEGGDAGERASGQARAHVHHTLHTRICTRTKGGNLHVGVSLSNFRVGNLFVAAGSGGRAGAVSLTSPSATACSLRDTTDCSKNNVLFAPISAEHGGSNRPYTTYQHQYIVIVVEP